ncbi:MAG: MBOAT family protein [Lachnospiraceae bacterium]|nr:MBOAT family protein [Lachnospiraceae bacterium]
MGYTSLKYYILVIIALFLYYFLPKKIRWIILLVANIFFYFVITKNVVQIAIFITTIISSFLLGLYICNQRIKKESIRIRRITLLVGIIIVISPLIFSKAGFFIWSFTDNTVILDWILPVGLSFYSMQISAYLIDLYRGNILPQKNILKYFLFTSFFPIIIQGPISRYEQLSDQLVEGHDYDIQNIMKGIQLIIWGFFLKYVIADKAAVFVDAVFENHTAYSGMIILIAGGLYSIQLYTDFLSCVTMSQGVAQMFGIQIIDNFNHPYFSASVKEFWHRWHISFSSWLRDYVYIPLGGNRNGKISKYCNLIITFAISGIWHGGKWKFLFWGLLHAFYQIIEEITYKAKEKCFLFAFGEKESVSRKFVETLFTSFFIMISWIIFRARSLKVGIKMIVSIFSDFNVWVLFDNSLFRFGLNQKEFEILFLAILVLIFVSLLQEKGIQIRKWFSEQTVVIRWTIYLCAIWSIWIFGTYGFGFTTQDFIYGGF